MRLIDADALRTEFQEPNDFRDPQQTLFHITGIWAAIDNAPTIEPQPCEDAVSRQEAIEAMLEAYEDSDAKWILEKLPSVQPQRKRGKWIGTEGLDFPQCSACGRWLDVLQGDAKLNYCPNCGAEMMEETE